MCLDIINRWVHPIVPEYQFGGKASSSESLRTNYVQQKYNIYKDRSVRISRSAKLANSVVIGKDCSLGEHVALSKSILGNVCSVGSKSVISNSHLWTSK